MIVRARDEREIVRLRNAQDGRAVALQHADPFRSTVGELDRDEAGDAGELRLRDRFELPRDREDEDRRIRDIHRRIVPLAPAIGCDVRRDVERDDVLGVIPCLERGEEDRRAAAVRRISREPLDRALDTLVVGDVCDVEAAGGMPGAVAIRGEPALPVPRVIRVTVEVDRDVVRVREAERGHRARDDRAGGVHHEPSDQARERNADLVHRRRLVPTRSQDPPRDQYHDERDEHRGVLLQRQDGQCVERRADGSEHDVREWPHERRIGDPPLRERVHDRRCRQGCGHEHQRREDECRARRGAARESHAP